MVGIHCIDLSIDSISVGRKHASTTAESASSKGLRAMSDKPPRRRPGKDDRTPIQLVPGASSEKPQDGHDPSANGDGHSMLPPGSNNNKAGLTSSSDQRGARPSLQQHRGQSFSARHGIDALLVENQSSRKAEAIAERMKKAAIAAKVKTAKDALKQHVRNRGKSFGIGAAPPRQHAHDEEAAAASESASSVGGKSTNDGRTGKRESSPAHLDDSRRTHDSHGRSSRDTTREASAEDAKFESAMDDGVINAGLENESTPSDPSRYVSARGTAQSSDTCRPTPRRLHRDPSQRRTMIAAQAARRAFCSADEGMQGMSYEKRLRLREIEAMEGRIASTGCGDLSHIESKTRIREEETSKKKGKAQCSDRPSRHRNSTSRNRHINGTTSRSARSLESSQVRRGSCESQLRKTLSATRAMQAAREKHAHQTSDLLFEVFPRHVARALLEGRKVEPESREVVTIFFSDIVGFTEISSLLPPIKVSDLLDRLYSGFDALSRKHDIFKVETIGDAYMAVTNLVKDQPDHAKRIAEFAIDAVRVANKTLVDTDDPTGGYVNIRVGFHSGPVVANVVGSRNPRYCLFGDSVNTASRMESSSKVNRIHCSESAAGLLREQFPELALKSRGKIDVKGKGEMRTYWVNEERRRRRSRSRGKGGSRLTPTSSNAEAA